MSNTMTDAQFVAEKCKYLKPNDVVQVYVVPHQWPSSQYFLRLRCNHKRWPSHAGKTSACFVCDCRSLTTAEKRAAKLQAMFDRAIQKLRAVKR
jgi:hypothetical protein